jgi:hypothetical protein
VRLRNVATAESRGVFVEVETQGPSVETPEPLSVPARAAIYEEYLDGQGGVQLRHRLPFLAAYAHRVVRAEETGVSGRVELVSTRLPLDDSSQWHRYENATVPNDPWPGEFLLVVAWNCAAPGG